MFTTRRSRAILIVSQIALFIFAGVMAVAIGATDIPVRVVLEGIKSFFVTLDPASVNADSVDLQIVRDVRFPRVLLGGIVGAGLAVCGLITQALLRNPLGDPYILGVSSGASTGAAIVIVLGSSSAFLSSLGVTLGAFLGALIAILLLSLLAAAGGRVTPTRIIFAGMAVNYFFSALTSLVTIMAKNAAGTKSVMFWMLGSLSASQWKDVAIAGTATTLAFILFYLFGRRVDVLNLGDDTARSLGTNPRYYRNLLFVVVAFTVAVLVSLTGAIGFIGLVIPHLAKLLVGRTTRAALPVAVLSGAVLVILADTCARIVIRPAELPIGILTALVGTPMLMALIKRYSN